MAGPFGIDPYYGRRGGAHKITGRCPSRRNRYMIKSEFDWLQFELGVTAAQEKLAQENRVREALAQRGFRLMHRRGNQYWVMYSQPQTLDEIEHELSPKATGRSARRSETLRGSARKLRGEAPRHALRAMQRQVSK